MLGPKDKIEGPGFSYNPNLEFSSVNRASKVHSFGSVPKNKKSKGQALKTSTPINIGPNSYHPNYKILSEIKNSANQPFTKKERDLNTHQHKNHYDSGMSYSAIGSQVLSNKRTESKISMAKATTLANNSGFLDAKMLKMSLPHANY